MAAAHTAASTHAPCPKSCRTRTKIAEHRHVDTQTDAEGYPTGRCQKQTTPTGHRRLANICRLPFCPKLGRVFATRSALPPWDHERPTRERITTTAHEAPFTRLREGGLPRPFNTCAPNAKRSSEGPLPRANLSQMHYASAFARDGYPSLHTWSGANSTSGDSRHTSAPSAIYAPSRGTATPAFRHGPGPFLPRAILDITALHAPFTRLHEGLLPRPSDLVRGHFYLGLLHTARKGRLPRPSAPPTFKRWERGLRSGFDEFERQTQVISLRRIPQTPIDIFESITHRAQTRHYAYAPRIILDRQQLRIDRARP